MSIVISRVKTGRTRFPMSFSWLILLSICSLLAISGCGSGMRLAVATLNTSITINAGQSIQIPVTATTGYTWSLAGTACNGVGCGSVNVANQSNILYTAPRSLPSQIKVTIGARSPIGQAAGTIAVTVNPAISVSNINGNAAVGVAYAAKIVASGGSGPVQLSVDTGLLPPGLGFNTANSMLAGTPTKPGTFTVSVRATDASDADTDMSAEGKLQVSNSATPLKVTTQSLPEATVNKAYAAQISASGGISPYTWRVAQGTLPPGISLDSTGALSGQPTISGSYNFSAEVTDSTSAKVSTPLTLVVSSAPDPLKIVTSSMPAATVGVGYSSTINATGGVAPYLCSVSSGTLPNGLALSGCSISGVPTLGGTFAFAIKVTDASGTAATATLSIAVNSPAMALSLASPPSGTAGSRYAGTIGVSGGIAPYTCSLMSGALPPGLQISNCSITGTPSQAGLSNLTIRATDASSPSNSVTGNVVVSIAAAPPDPGLSISLQLSATVGQSYVGVLGVSGGSAPYSCAIISGAAPPGLSLNGCTLSGTPTNAGTYTFSAKATDSSSPVRTGTQTIAMTVSAATAPVSLSISSPVSAIANTAYTGTVAVAGGKAPYACALLSGVVPAGLSLNGCTFTGTPTTAGIYTLSMRANDSSSPSNSGIGTVTLVVTAAPVTLAIASPPAARANTAYTGALTISGGKAPYSCSVAGGSVPAGLTLNGCTFTGTPTTAGTYSLAIGATDSSSPANSGTGAISIPVAPAPVTLTIASPASATVGTAYTGALAVSGGNAPYACSVVGGTVPPGLALNGCIFTGTPTAAGAYNLSVRATDSNSPANTGTSPISITVAAAPVTLTIASPPSATAGTPYTGALTVSGGKAPYACAVVGGSVPAGLSLNGCTFAGTPTAAGNYNLAIRATDSSSPTNSGTSAVSIAVAPAPVTLAIASPPPATVGTAYTGALAVSGGDDPYSCAVVSGNVPAGLSFTGCTFSGTPTAAGTYNLSVRATDSSSPANSGTSSITLTVSPAPVTLTITSPPPATVGSAYLGTIGVSGGQAPYSCSIASGNIPSGLTLNGCTLTGTPTAAGNSLLSIRATDSKSPASSGTGMVTITVAPTPVTLTVSSPAAPATADEAYNGALVIAGGKAPYACSVVGGNVPTGLTLNGCAFTGIPSVAGNYLVSVRVSDSSSPVASTTASVAVIVKPAPATLTLDPPPSGTVGVSYQGDIQVSGGSAPYSCAVANGSLPPGLSLTDCTLDGTPTTAGNYTFSIRGSDSSSPANTAVVPMNLTIAAAPVSLTVTGPTNPGTIGLSYTGPVNVSGGSAPYSCSVVTGSMPPGIALNGCSFAGTPTAVGTYTLSVKATDASSPANSGIGNATITIAAIPVTLSISSPPSATATLPYIGALAIGGGNAPYACSVASGSVPAGLVLNGCTFTGTPTTAGTYNLSITATDASSPANSGTGAITISVAAAPVPLSISSPPPAIVNAAYTGALPISGGRAPYTCSVVGGTVPAGLTLNGCAFIGTPTRAGAYPINVRATDSTTPANTSTSLITVTVNPAPVNLAIASPVAATVGVSYVGVLGVTGGIAPYACTIVSGTAPSGLTLNGCTFTGTPTTTGNYTLSIRANDSSSPLNTGTSTITITVATAPVTLTIASPPSATASRPYTGALTVSGGKAPYTCSVASGTVPAGLTLNGCTFTGTPTTPGTYTLSIRANDSSSPLNTGTSPISITVAAAPVTLTIASPPSATVNTAYTGALTVSGGRAPYTCAVASGTVPPGLALNGCTFTGTPTTAGTYTLSIRANDSSSPLNTGTSAITVTVAAAPVTLTIASPPSATVNTAYTGALTVSGGRAPYTCAVASGTVPPGLALVGCSFIGIPTTAGTYTLSIRANDSNSPANTGTSTVTITVAATLTISSPPAATANAAYTGALTITGGNAPYTCAVVSGSVPVGLTLNGCSFTGTPTAAGSYVLSIKATDSSILANSSTGSITITVKPSTSTGNTIIPHINYTDLNVGSGTGGDNGNGVYVRIFGSNFGAAQGSSTVMLGGSLITNCSLCSWSDTQIIAQLGSSASTGEIVVTVNGLPSNGMPFTVTPTTIVFVSPTGSDSNSGTFTSPFKTWRAAFNLVTAKDSRNTSQNSVIYLEPGTDVTFDDGRAYKAAVSLSHGGASPTNQLSIVGYPGGVVTVGSTGVTNGAKGWANYVTLANLNIVAQVSAIDAEAGNIRIINNSISCPAPPSGVGGTACVLGETEDPTETWVFHGNNVHDTGGKVDKTYHAVYFSSNVNHADIGWNNVGQNFKGYCRGIMFHATLGANQFDLHLHDNVITNSYCDGIGLASVDPSKGTVEVYNNVISHVALASNPYGVANEVGIAINSDPAGSSSGNVEVYNNTVVDAGAYTIGNQNGCFGVVFSGAGIHLTNNICSQPSTSQPYIEKGSTNVSGSNNLWFGAGPAPSWDTAPVNSDPKFVSGTDYSLQTQSPAKSIGTTTHTSPIDIVGTPRGDDPSLGAYQ